eukprot:scaffold242349_cov30-Tisochrysis_lutea.AAC.1
MSLGQRETPPASAARMLQTASSSSVSDPSGRPTFPPSAERNLHLAVSRASDASMERPAASACAAASDARAPSQPGMWARPVPQPAACRVAAARWRGVGACQNWTTPALPLRSGSAACQRTIRSKAAETLSRHIAEYPGAGAAPAACGCPCCAWLRQSP